MKFRSNRRSSIVGICLTIAFVFITASSASAANDCDFDTNGTEMVLQGSCTTDATITIPNGFSMDLNGFTITGVDPAGGHFVGAVVKNAGPEATISNGTITVTGLSDVCDPGADRLRGVMFEGASGSITNLRVININQGASGCQEGNAVEVRNFGDSPTTTRVTIDGNTVTGYQKTGILANGDVNVTITNNVVSGLGPVGYIARNGVQVGYGATGIIKRNTINGNSYTGVSTVSTGVIIVGGPGFGGAFCVGVQIMQNELNGNDVGVYAAQYEADFSAPATATNLKIVNNTIVNGAVTNGYVYQAGVADVGNNDKIISNRISGAGYTSLPGSTFLVDADPAFTNRARVHANR